MRMITSDWHFFINMENKCHNIYFPCLLWLNGGEETSILACMEPLLGNLIVLLLLLLVVGKSAAWAVRGAISLSHAFGWSAFAVSFLVVLVSILPETIVSVFAAMSGVPALGLGTLLGSNVADLTFVLGMVAIFSAKPLQVESGFIKKDHVYLAFLALPLLLGFTGHYSRVDGILLIVSSIFFLWVMLDKAASAEKMPVNLNGFTRAKSMSITAAALLALAASAYYAVDYAVRLATGFGVAPALVGLLVVALGTTLPELLFSLRAAQKARASLALGDILGTVIADATLVLGIIAVIHPFSFNPRLIVLTGFFMLLAGIFSLSLLRSGKALTRGEGALLLAFYALFVMVEFMLRDWTPLI